MPHARNFFHVTRVRDLIPACDFTRDPWTWPLCSSTHFAELSRLSISSRFCQKRNFLDCQRSIVSVRNISHDFFIHAEHPLLVNCLVVFVLSLEKPFYNSKSSKPNGSASLFKRRNRRPLVSPSRLFIQPVQWPDFVLGGAFVKTPHRSSAPTMSILSIKPIKALKKLFSMTVVLVLKLIFRVSKSFNQ